MFECAKNFEKLLLFTIFVSVVANELQHFE